MEGIGGGLTLGDVIGAVGRWAMLVGITLAIGAVSFRLLLALVGQPPRPIRDRSRRAAAWGLTAALMLVGSAIVRLTFQVVSLSDPGATGSSLWQLLIAIATDTNWGHVWLVHTTLAVVAAVAFSFAKRGPRAAWVTAAVAAAGLAATPAFAGHAIGVERHRFVVVAADALHVIGAGVWLGTLGVLAGVMLRDPGTPKRRAPQDWGTDISAVVRAFSPVALTSAAIVSATGVIAAWVHLDSVASLWRTDYGRALLVKLSLVVLALAAGAYNWQYATAALTAEGGVQKFRRSGFTEVVVSALILLATAVLIALPLPE